MLRACDDRQGSHREAFSKFHSADNVELASLKLNHE